MCACSIDLEWERRYTPKQGIASDQNNRCSAPDSWRVLQQQKDSSRLVPGWGGGCGRGAETGWCLSPQRRVLEERQEEVAAGQKTLREDCAKRAGWHTVVTFALYSTKSPAKILFWLIPGGGVSTLAWEAPPVRAERVGSRRAWARGLGRRRPVPSPGSRPGMSGCRPVRARERERHSRSGRRQTCPRATCRAQG